MQNPGHPPTGVYRFVLPMPPSINSQYIVAGRRRVLSAGAKAFRKDVKKIVERARLDGTLTAAGEAELSRGFLGVYLTFYFETPMRRDLDGGLKIALDAVCDSLGLDDRIVVDIHLIKRIDPLRPRLEMEIEPISEWSFDRSYVYLGEEPETVAPEGDDK